MSGGGHGFSSSSTTVMHYSSDGHGGSPHVYHATSSTRQGPGGVRVCVSVCVCVCSLVVRLFIFR